MSDDIKNATPAQLRAMQRECKATKNSDIASRSEKSRAAKLENKVVAEMVRRLEEN